MPISRTSPIHLPGGDAMRAAVFGLGRAGEATARALVLHDYDVVLSDDNLSTGHQQLASELSCELLSVDNSSSRSQFLEGVDLLVPAPGVAPHHPVIVSALKKGIAVRSEIDIAYEWEQMRAGGPRPILGVTGTDGKTTTTMMAAELLRSQGRSVGEVGNTDLPFVTAVDQPFDAFVVECSSFRLNFTTAFRCDASAWLNLAPDHLDWHGSIEEYTAAKRQMWAHVTSIDVVVAPAGNSMIVDVAHSSGARCVTFGIDSGDYRVEHGSLVCPSGEIMATSDLWRSLPHDITNSLAATAMVIESGLCDVKEVSIPLGAFESAHHRIELVGQFEESAWYDDSKATSPHAALAAIRSFDRIVLIAGGRNKDLDLSQMATEASRVIGVVAIGEDSDAVAEAFAGKCPVRIAGSMSQAVAEAHGLIRDGATVLLSPGCTSYDWYANYNERGDDFQRQVREHFKSSER